MNPEMRPAFSSVQQAAWFALLLGVILLSPVLMRGRLLPSSRENYLQQGWDTFGDYPQLYHHIFEETGDIDIAFVGSSRVWLGIDTAYVQQQLSEHLGRPAVVRTIAWGWSGWDKFFFAMRDLLQHRHVKLLVLNDEGQSVNLMDPFARRWFRLGDADASLAGFPIRLQADYYFSALLGIPRNLLDLLRSNLPVEMSATQREKLEETYFCTNSLAGLGSLALQQGYSQMPIFQPGHPPFEAFTPTDNPHPLASASIYSAATKDEFEFSGPPMLIPQRYYAQKFGVMAAKYSLRLVMLHVPEIADLNRRAIVEREYWADTLRTDIALLGVVPQKFIARMTDEEIHKLFAEPYHLNQNGQQYFTRLITPALIQLYETTGKP